MNKDKEQRTVVMVVIGIVTLLGICGLGIFVFMFGFAPFSASPPSVGSVPPTGVTGKATVSFTPDVPVEPDDDAMLPSATPAPNFPITAVLTPEDVIDYFEAWPDDNKQRLADDLVVTFSYPHPLGDWVGGAVIYHIPSVSAVVLDFNGRFLPEYTHYENEAGQARLEEVLADEPLLKELQNQVLARWEDVPTVTLAAPRSTITSEAVDVEAFAPNALLLLYLQNDTLSLLQVDGMVTEPVNMQAQNDIFAALLDDNGRYLAYEFENSLYLLDTMRPNDEISPWLEGSIEPWQKLSPRSWNGNGRLLVQRSYGTESSTLGWAEMGDNNWHPLPLPDGITVEFYGFDSGADWSPHGTQIVIGGYSWGIASNVPGLTVIDMETAVAQRIVTRPIASGIPDSEPIIAGAYMPAWSPNGEWIAVALEEDANEPLIFPQRLYLIHPDGTGLIPISNNEQGQASNPLWIADDSLYYSITNSTGENAADGIHHYNLSTQTDRLLIPGTNLAPISLSPDGNFLVYSQTQIRSNLFLQDLNLWQVDTGQTMPIAQGQDGVPMQFVGWYLED